MSRFFYFNPFAADSRAGRIFKRARAFRFAGKSLGAAYGYLAGDDDLRARDLEDMFEDESIAAIICMLGGYGSSRIVDKLNYRLIASRPKLFVGFSDITVLLNAIYRYAGIPTAHGALGVYLGNPGFDEFSRRDFEALLFQNQKGRVLKNPYDDAETIVGGAARAFLSAELEFGCRYGRNPYEVDFTDKIVFLEDVDEKPYRIDRYLSTLRLSGKLAKAKGLSLARSVIVTMPPRHGNVATSLNNT